MNTLVRMPGGLPLSVLVVLAGLADARAADDLPFARGDTVVVAADDVKFSLGKKILATLKKGTEFRVVEVRGKWIGAKLTIDGKLIAGWVKGSDVKPAGPSGDDTPDLPAKPDDKNAVDALKKMGIRLELNEKSAVGMVDASGSKFDDAALVHLQGLHSLAELELRGTQITDAGLSHLKGIGSLKMLYVDETKVGNDGLKHLKDLKGLEVLALSDTKITGDGLVHLAGLRNLRVLNLSGNRIEDACALKNLKDLVNLETVALQGTGIDGSGLVHFKGLANLITLNLNDLEIKGKSLLHLKGLSKLRIIYVKNSTVDEESVNELDKAVPSVAIFD